MLDASPAPRICPLFVEGECTALWPARPVGAMQRAVACTGGGYAHCPRYQAVLAAASGPLVLAKPRGRRRRTAGLVGLVVLAHLVLAALIAGPFRDLGLADQPIVHGAGAQGPVVPLVVAPPSASPTSGL